MANILSKLINGVKSFYLHSSNERFVKYLRDKGVRVGGAQIFVLIPLK